MKALVVTDPMCSWCWGMAPAVEDAAHRLRNVVEFDILLGGINTHASHDLGEFGRRHLMRIWQEVERTTGQHFGYRLPEPLVYNSTLPCLAVQAVRQLRGKPPFGYLHRLQQLFFAEGRNINDPDLLAATAEDFQCPRSEMLDRLADPALERQLADEFATSRVYGTNALPSVLVERDGKRSLLVGGYVDAEMLVGLIESQAEPSRRR